MGVDVEVLIKGCVCRKSGHYQLNLCNELA